MFIVIRCFWRVIHLHYFSLFQPLEFLSVFGLAFPLSLIIKVAHGNQLRRTHIISDAYISKEESQPETFWVMVSSRNGAGFKKAHKVLILQFRKVLTFHYGLFVVCFPVLYWVRLQERWEEKKGKRWGTGFVTLIILNAKHKLFLATKTPPAAILKPYALHLIYHQWLPGCTQSLSA